jgi:hypothetical protein
VLVACPSWRSPQMKGTVTNTGHRLTCHSGARGRCGLPGDRGSQDGRPDHGPLQRLTQRGATE